MALPLFKTDNLQMQLLQSQWKSQLDPLLSKQLTQGLMLKGIKLINGEVTVNHLLDQLMVGWMLIDVDGPATIYRSKPLNDKTISLTSNVACNASLWVF